MTNPRQTAEAYLITTAIGGFFKNKTLGAVKFKTLHDDTLQPRCSADKGPSSIPLVALTGVRSSLIYKPCTFPATLLCDVALGGCLEVLRRSFRYSFHTFIASRLACIQIMAHVSSSAVVNPEDFMQKIQGQQKTREILPFDVTDDGLDQDHHHGHLRDHQQQQNIGFTRLDAREMKRMGKKQELRVCASGLYHALSIQAHGQPEKLPGIISHGIHHHPSGNVGGFAYGYHSRTGKRRPCRVSVVIRLDLLWAFLCCPLPSGDGLDGPDFRSVIDP